MRLIDTLHLSIESFRNRKSRTFLTVLGVSIGIGAVLFLVSFGYGLQNILLERITTSESFLTLDVASSDSKIVVLNDETVDNIRHLENVVTVSPQAAVSGQISFANLTSETTLNIVDQNFFSLNGVLPQQGKSFTDADPNTIVINSRVAELFNIDLKDALSQKMKITAFPPTVIDENGKESDKKPAPIEKEFTIIGIIEEGDASQVYIARKDIPELPIQEYQAVKVKFTATEFLPAAREQLIEMGFVVSSISDIVDQANKIFRIIQFILGIFGVIAVVVAAISLANTMTISLLERTQDIGVMRSIGASSKDISRLFLIESTVIGFGGGVFGLFLGWTVAFIFNQIMRILANSLGGQAVDLFKTPFWFVIFILVFSTGVGFLTGLFPARRAGKLNPLQALRYK